MCLNRSCFNTNWKEKKSKTQHRKVANFLLLSLVYLSCWCHNSFVRLNQISFVSNWKSVSRLVGWLVDWVSERVVARGRSQAHSKCSKSDFLPLTSSVFVTLTNKSRRRTNGPRHCPEKLTSKWPKVWTSGITDRLFFRAKFNNSWISSTLKTKKTSHCQRTSPVHNIISHELCRIPTFCTPGVQPI